MRAYKNDKYEFNKFCLIKKVINRPVQISCKDLKACSLLELRMTVCLV